MTRSAAGTPEPTDGCQSIKINHIEHLHSTLGYIDRPRCLHLSNVACASGEPVATLQRVVGEGTGVEEVRKRVGRAQGAAEIWARHWRTKPNRCACLRPGTDASVAAGNEPGDARQRTGPHFPAVFELLIRRPP